jgi:uncharacterized protein (DUF427 family)
MFNNMTVADSTEMMLLRQHGFLPVYYFPVAHVRTDLFEKSAHTTFSPYKGVASYFDLHVGRRVTRAAAWTYEDPLPGSPDTRRYISFHWHGMDAWLEEDEFVHVHARDPYLRAETLSSSRRIVVRLAGEIVADTSRAVLLLETGLVTRYYIPPPDVRRELFVQSQSYSKCPYKGTARYLSYNSAGVQIADAAWYYQSPLCDVRKITGHVCFWNERPETTIEVDGVELPHLGVRGSTAGGELLYPSRRFFSVPPPATMADAVPGQLQHDFARPNGRVEGPPDDLIDMDVERAGGRRPTGGGGGAGPPRARVGGSADAAADGTPATGGGGPSRLGDAGSPADGAGSSLLFTFGPGRRRSVAAEALENPGQPPADGTGSDVWPAAICEPALRRVRAVVGGVVVADSKDAVLWADGDGKAAYYFPADDVRRELLSGSGRTSSNGSLGPMGLYSFRTITGSSPGCAVAFSPLDPPPGLDVLRDRLAFDWGAVDSWFEEDDEVHGSPRVPYHRVDAIGSGRHVMVTLGGRLLAESRRSIAVFETDQPARYYLSRLDTALGMLTPSERRHKSPYLGTACYFSAVLDGRLFADVAWSYPFPSPSARR